MIPPLEDGVLPEGVHDATVDEVVAEFGRFQRSDRRTVLTERLKTYLDDARRSGLVAAVLIDGSYATAKDEPEDIDIIVALKPGVVWESLRPFEYNAASKRIIRTLYRFDALVCVEGDARYHIALAFFSRVNPDKPADYTTRTRKGLVRVQL